MIWKQKSCMYTIIWKNFIPQKNYVTGSMTSAIFSAINWILPLNDYHQKLCESVTSYIDENYASNTLCLNDIASEANVSPAYLSALFKKKQGVSISDYITTQTNQRRLPLSYSHKHDSEGNQYEMRLRQSILFQHKLQERK